MPRQMSRGIAALSTCVAFTSALAQAPSATDASSRYSQPPKEILEVMRSPSPPTAMVSPRRDMILLVSLQDYPSIARVATPYLRLAGVRVETGNHSRHDTPGGYGITPCARSLDLVRVADGAQTHVDLPAQSCATHPRWSADGERFAFENIGAESVDLWVGDAKTGVAQRIPGVRLNPMLDDEVHWTSDQRHLIVKLVPENMGPPPSKPPSPPGPSIQESAGEKGQSSTYETRDTLGSAHDEALFDYYATSQLAIVDVVAGNGVPFGKPDLYTTVHLAPDGRHLLVAAIRRPYSYVTTYDRFAEDVDVWDIASRPVRNAYHVASLALADRVPIRGVRLGPRHFEWRATEPATLVWAEALDGGDWNVKVPARDKVMLAKAPFDAATVEIARTEQRFGGFAWSEKPDVAFLDEYDVNRHWRRTFVMDVDNPQKASRLLWDLSTDEKYANPGNPVYRQLANGAWVVQQEGDAIFLRGTGSSPAGDRPFLDRLDLATGKSERLWRSGTDSYEHFLAFAGGTSRSFITWHQSSNDPPNAFMRTLGDPVQSSEGEAAYASKRTAITRMPDPAPLVRQIKKRLVKYKRADGLDLSFTLYTPPGYREGTRVPTILYAYPLDYADASKAGQVTGSQETFTRLRQYQLLLLAGYAIIGNASFPVIGDPKRAYDTYLEQLVADAKAAVDEAVRLGVADPERIGVTGHSHGALMTVNLIAHSDLFRAGVATSGSYNKMLT
ncbi:MAG TPA: prolyl oligopeptidase family serine peptidase, partial [Usitatibacter sp.]